MSDEVFRQLYAEHYRRTCAYLLHLGVPPDVVQDLAQETFVRVYERIGEYRGEARWSYLARVAHTVALNYIRDRKAKKRSAPEESLEAVENMDGVAATLITPESMASEREQRERLVSAIAELPETIRLCFLMQMRGSSYTEIAQMLGITQSAVKARLFEGRRRLIALLANSQ